MIRQRFGPHHIEASLRRRPSKEARRRAQMMDLVFAVRELIRDGKTIAQVADAILSDPGFDLLPEPRGMMIGEWYRFHHQEVN